MSGPKLNDITPDEVEVDTPGGFHLQADDTINNTINNIINDNNDGGDAKVNMSLDNSILTPYENVEEGNLESIFGADLVKFYQR